MVKNVQHSDAVCLSSAHRMERQVDIWEVNIILDYILSSNIVRGDTFEKMFENKSACLHYTRYVDL